MSEISSRSAEYKRNRKLALDRDGWICTYCRCELIEGRNATADHVVSKATWIREGRPGSPDALDNLVASCTSCNSSKGDRDTMPRITYYNPRWFAGMTLGQ